MQRFPSPAPVPGIPPAGMYKVAEQAGLGFPTLASRQTLPQPPSDIHPVTTFLIYFFKCGFEIHTKFLLQFLSSIYPYVHLKCNKLITTLVCFAKITI